MKQSAINLSDEARRHFNNQVEQMQRRRKRWQIIGALIALCLTHGLVVYFLAATIIKALL